MAAEREVIEYTLPHEVCQWRGIPGTQCDAYEFWEFDLGHSITECLIPSANAFYNEQVMSWSFNLEIKKKGMYSFYASELISPKNANAIISIQDYMFLKFKSSRGQQFISFDTANTNLNYNAIKYWHYISSKYSQERLFLNLTAVMQPMGDSWMPNDGLAWQAEEIWGMKEGGFLTLADRVDFLAEHNPSFGCEILDRSIFKNWNDAFKKTDIYIASEKWVDQNGIKFKVREDKPIWISFGHSNIMKKNMNPAIGWESWSVEHPDEIYVRQSDDFTIPPRRIRIVNSKYYKKKLPLIVPEPIEAPKISQKKLESTKNLIASSVTATEEELNQAFEYYSLPMDRISDDVKKNPQEKMKDGSYCGVVANQMSHIEVLKGNKEFIKKLGPRKIVGKAPCEGNVEIKLPESCTIIRSLADWDALPKKITTRKTMRFLCGRCNLNLAKFGVKVMREQFRIHLEEKHF